MSEKMQRANNGLNPPKMVQQSVEKRGFNPPKTAQPKPKEQPKK